MILIGIQSKYIARTLKFGYEKYRQDDFYGQTPVFHKNEWGVMVAVLNIR